MNILLTCKMTDRRPLTKKEKEQQKAYHEQFPLLNALRPYYLNGLPGLGPPTFHVHEEGGAAAWFPLVSGDHPQGTNLVVSLSEVDPLTLPGRELTEVEKVASRVLSPIVPDGRVCAPSAVPGAVAAFVWEDKWVLARVTVEHSKVARKKLKDQARREAEMQRDREERQRQLEAKHAAEQAALEAKAKSGGFPDVATMLAAEAKAAAELAEAERLRKQAAEDERNRVRREEEAALKAQKAAIALRNKAEREAAKAERLAKWPRDASTSPPQGGKAVGKR